MAERQQYVALAGSQRWWRVLGLGLGAVCAQRVAKDQAALADPDLVAMPQSLRGPDPLAVDPCPVRRAQIGDAPAGREGLENGVQAAGGRVFGEADVVLGCLTDCRSLRLERESPALYAEHDFDLRAHTRKVKRTARRRVKDHDDGDTDQ